MMASLLADDAAAAGKFFDVSRRTRVSKNVIKKYNVVCNIIFWGPKKFILIKSFKTSVRHTLACGLFGFVCAHEPTRQCIEGN